MKNLNRLATSLVALVFVIAFSSCEKQPVDAKQDVTFSITNVTDNLKKGIIAPDNPYEDTIPDCSTDPASYVMIGLDEAAPIKLDLLSLEDGTQTVVMKLDAPATHIINSFTVHAADGEMIWAAPKTGSKFANMWGLIGLDLPFDVIAFTKTKVNIDVLCWEPYSYKEFGFNWFDFQEVTIKTMCFFGDVCTKFYDDFYTDERSPYNRGDQVERGYDMPAIMEMIVRDKISGKVVNDTTTIGGIKKNSNASWFGEGSPLCVEYPDFGDIPNEELTFEIWLAYPDGSYNLVHTSQSFYAETATYVSDGTDVTGAENIFDFVVGNCSSESNISQVELPPYLYLPETGHIDVTAVRHAPPIYEYFDVTLMGSSWDNILYPEELGDGKVLGAYCGDLYSYISVSREYDVDIYSSLKPNSIPPLYDGYNWGALNWLINQDHAITEAHYEGKFLQAIVWFIIHRDQDLDSNGNSHTPAQLYSRIRGHQSLTVAQANEAKAIADYALDYMSGYIPATGEFSVVILDPIETSGNTAGTPNIQLVVVRVDP